MGIMHNSVIGVINRLCGVRQTFGATQVGGRGQETIEKDNAKSKVKKIVKKELKIQRSVGFMYFFGAVLVLAISLYFFLPLTVFIILAGLSSLNIIQSICAPVYFDNVNTGTTEKTQLNPQ